MQVSIPRRSTINGRLKRRFSPRHEAPQYACRNRPGNERYWYVSSPPVAGDTLGYARVSTNEQNPEAQRARLIDAGAIRVFTDVISGKRFERPGLDRAHRPRPPRGSPLRHPARPPGAVSAASCSKPLTTLKARGIHLVSLEERLDTSSAAGELVFHVFGCDRALRGAGSSPSAPATASPRRENAGAHRGARRLTRRPFPRRANSSKAACRPLGPRNSSRSAGQRLTESPLRCATRIRRPYRNPTNKPSDDAFIVGAIWSAAGCRRYRMRLRLISTAGRIAHERQGSSSTGGSDTRARQCAPPKHTG